MTDDEKQLIRNLLDGWEGALHIADTYLQIVETVPNRRELIQEHRDNPLRKEATRTRFAPIRQGVEAAMAGASGDSLRRLFEPLLNPKPN